MSKIIYNSLILPLFDYADIIYDSANTKYTKQLQTLQNRAGRTILRISPFKHTSNYELHEILKWESLNTRRKKHINSMVFKCLNNLTAPYLKDSFKFLSHNYSLRSNGKLLLPKPRTEYCRKMFAYRGASNFNDLPPESKSCLNTMAFNRSLNEVIPKFT